MLALNRLFYLYMGPFFYYDFLVGEPNSHPDTWSYQALKIAAKSPKMAAYFKMLLIQDFKSKATPNEILMFARMSVRVIVEYELTSRQGKTKYRFKKKAEYRIQEDLKVC